MAAQKELAQRITHVCLLNTRFASVNQRHTVLQYLQWFGLARQPLWLSPPCLRTLSFFSVCGVAHVLLLSWRPLPRNTGVRKKKTRQPHGNLLRALLNKVFKYYPKLKDIHTCLKSSPLLPFSLPPFLSLSKHSSRCGLVSMVTICITQPGPLDFSFRCSWVTAPTGNVLPYTQCRELYD